MNLETSGKESGKNLEHSQAQTIHLLNRKTTMNLMSFAAYFKNMPAIVGIGH